MLFLGSVPLTANFRLKKKVAGWYHEFSKKTRSQALLLIIPGNKRATSTNPLPTEESALFDFLTKGRIFLSRIAPTELHSLPCLAAALRSFNIKPTFLLRAPSFNTRSS